MDGMFRKVERVFGCWEFHETRVSLVYGSFATCVKRRVISVCENMCLICDN